MISLNAAIWRTFSAYIYRITRRSLRSNFCLHARTQVSKAPAISMDDGSTLYCTMVHRWHTTTTLTKCVVVWCCGCCFEYPQLQHLTKCVVVWCCGCCFEYPQLQHLTKCVVVWCCGCCFEYPQQQHLTKCKCFLV